jgi:HAD superfamily hydrolase (TIGR01509 family)
VPGRDLGRDLGCDLGSDPGRDLGCDLGSDPGRDLGCDLGSDPGRDLGSDRAPLLFTERLGKGRRGGQPRIPPSPGDTRIMLQAVVFDLDGVLLDSEHLWDAARRSLVAREGGTWRDDATEAMQGMSSPEWSRYVREQLGVPLAEERIVQIVVADLLARYRRDLPLLPGAVDAVRRLDAQWPLALASSSNRIVIEEVLDRSGLRGCFDAIVSSEEVAHGKPSPDVYLAATRALGAPAQDCAAVEDSANGIRAAAAARMHVVVVPNPHFPPPEDALANADLVIATLDELSVDVLAAMGGSEARLDEQEAESFPASDPHSDWAGF